jgi:hypothetical protein
MSKLNRLVGSIMLGLLGTPLFSQGASTWKDPSPHVTLFITVDKGVKLEVLDWGGSGRPLVLLAGGGNTAHVFDDFAPKLTDQYLGVALVFRSAARWAAIILFPYLIAWTLLKVPALVVAPKMEAVWLGFGEVVMLLSGGWVLFARFLVLSLP